MTNVGDDNVALVQAWLEAWAPGDTDGFVDAMDPAIEIHSEQEVGNEGTFHGRAGYRTWEGQWLDAWEDFQNEILSVEPVGRRQVIVDARQRGTGRGSGVEVDRTVSMLFDIRDGMLARFHVYSSHERAMSVARQGESRE